jgi:uncharacterized protein (DUF1778 family)
MGVLKRRYRLVTFRLSGDEYDVLVKSCLKGESRSVAEFARSAVLQTAHAVLTPADDLSVDLTKLTDVLLNLDAALTDTRHRIRNVLGEAHSEPHSRSERSVN